MEAGLSLSGKKYMRRKAAKARTPKEREELRVKGRTEREFLGIGTEDGILLGIGNYNAIQTIPWESGWQGDNFLQDDRGLESVSNSTVIRSYGFAQKSLPESTNSSQVAHSRASHNRRTLLDIIWEYFLFRAISPNIFISTKRGSCSYFEKVLQSQFRAPKSRSIRDHTRFHNRLKTCLNLGGPL
jgi:hypothetical protein